MKRKKGALLLLAGMIMIGVGLAMICHQRAAQKKEKPDTVLLHSDSISVAP